MTGPSLTVTLDDAPRTADQLPPGATPDDLVVHQQDVQGVVNALWSGGAEAMQIMDQRVIATSAVRCVGNTLILQGRVYSPPYTITAIGDPTRLRAGARRVVGGRGSTATTSTRYGLGCGHRRRRPRPRLPAYDGSLDLLCTRRPVRDARTPSGGIGEVLITAGLVVLLFVAYELVWTNVDGRPRTRGQVDRRAARSVGRSRSVERARLGRRRPSTFVKGKGFAFLHIPALGQALVESRRPGCRRCPTCPEGVGHYPQTALPGEIGNFAVAGHRATNGQPFAYLDKVHRRRRGRRRDPDDVVHLRGGPDEDRRARLVLGPRAGAGPARHEADPARCSR